MPEEIKTENWIDIMIERESIPKQLRTETVADFCKKYGIVESNYYYHSSKPEIKAKVIEIALNNAKKHAPEVLENLGERAKTNNADAKLYLQFILQLAEKSDITSNGEKLQSILVEFIDGKQKDNPNTD